MQLPCLCKIIIYSIQTLYTTSSCTEMDFYGSVTYCRLFLLLARYVPNVAKEEYYEISVRSVNTDDRPTTDDRRPTTNLRANSHILGKFLMSITLQRVNRSPSYLVIGWGFLGRQIERRRFRLDQIQVRSIDYRYLFVTATVQHQSVQRYSKHN